MKCVSKKYKSIPTYSKHSVEGLILVIFAALVWLFASPLWAASPAQQQGFVKNGEGQQQSLSMVKITIQKKSLQHIFTFGKSFAVNQETVIVGTDGKEVKLKKMLVPCDAEVRYLIENGTATAKRIDIKRVASDASWQWISENPE